MWRLMPFLFLLYIVAYLDRINVSFAVLQMGEPLHLTDKVKGLGFGMFFAGYFFFQVPSNLVLQKMGVRRWISGLMVTWGVVSCSMIFIRGRGHVPETTACGKGSCRGRIPLPPPLTENAAHRN